VSRKVWQFEVGDEQHTVDLQWSWFSFAGKVIVDGKLVDRWGSALRSKNIHFQVGEKPALLAFIVNPLSPSQQELYVGGILMKESSQK